MLRVILRCNDTAAADSRHP